MGDEDNGTLRLYDIGPDVSRGHRTARIKAGSNTDSVCFVPLVHKLLEQIVGVSVYPIFGRPSPEMSDVRILSKRIDASVSYVDRKETFRPEDRAASRTVCPGFFLVS